MPVTLPHHPTTTARYFDDRPSLNRFFFRHLLVV